MINEKNLKIRLKAFFSNGISYAIMKAFARLTFMKKLVSFFINLRLRESKRINLDQKESVFLSDDHSVISVIEDLNKYGVSSGLFLKKDIVSEINTYSNNNYSYVSGDPMKGYLLKDKEKIEEKNNLKIFVSRYFNIDYENQAFNRLKNSKLLNEIAQKYLGRGAMHVATQLWWTFPADVDEKTRSKFANFLHRDCDDWSFMKFFFYLNDVNEGSGPHEFVKGSHKPSVLQSFKENFRINRHYDTTVKSWYGSNNIITMTGKKGQGFAEDTFGLHKGKTPTENPRLVLCLVYALRDYGIQEWRYNKDNLGILSLQK